MHPVVNTWSQLSKNSAMIIETLSFEIHFSDFIMW